MRSFITFSTFAFALARADWNISPTPEKWETLEIPRYVPEVSVVEANKSYVVKLDCVGCPLAAKGEDNGFYWRAVQDQDNALRLQFSIEKTNGIDSTLLLNGRQILPLGSMPLAITTWQVPANLTTDAQDKFLLSPSSDSIPLQMAFEHTVLRTQEGAERMIQFDVTGVLSNEDKKVPVKLDGQGQKLVQIQLQVNKDTRELSIGDLQVVERDNRAQPFTMKCGRLAMAKTQFDPSEWDAYGKIGSWSRLFSQVFSFMDLHQNPLLLPLALMLCLVAFVVRRWYQRGEQDTQYGEDDEAQIGLLDFEFEDSPPAYANIPIIKIENYD